MLAKLRVLSRIFETGRKIGSGVGGSNFRREKAGESTSKLVVDAAAKWGANQSVHGIFGGNQTIGSDELNLGLIATRRNSEA